jgi:hypothetical protein
VPSWTEPESLKDKMLTIVYEQCSADPEARVHKETLAIEAWRRYPADFGMSRYHEHPNTSVAYSTLSKLTIEKLITLEQTSEYGIMREGIKRACRMVETPIAPPKKQKAPKRTDAAPAKQAPRQKIEGLEKHPDFLALLNKYKAPR